ncbi:MAG: hypothetical protein HY766_06250 [candidate division NC10 bacterium]|nr:hypothetical protein [candidate division NC10 bacterium]MBI4841022.1 hypothetical protein [candidate division NC10 bacterium]
MEPPEQVRQWIGELLGMPLEGDSTRKPLEAWSVLGPALAAVHGATVAMETEPVTVLVIPGSGGLGTGSETTGAA